MSPKWLRATTLSTFSFIACPEDICLLATILRSDTDRFWAVQCCRKVVMNTTLIDDSFWYFPDELPGRVSETWWRHQMETFSALLAICAGNSPVPGEFSTQRPVTWSFDVYFDLHPDKRLSEKSWGWWFETLSHPLWRHRNGEKPDSSIWYEHANIKYTRSFDSISKCNSWFESIPTTWKYHLIGNLFIDHKHLWVNLTCVERLICPANRVWPLSTCNPIQSSLESHWKRSIWYGFTRPLNPQMVHPLDVSLIVSWKTQHFDRPVYVMCIS